MRVLYQLKGSSGWRAGKTTHRMRPYRRILNEYGAVAIISFIMLPDGSVFDNTYKAWFWNVKRPAGFNRLWKEAIGGPEAT